MGQGIATSYAQLAVDVFGVPIEQIRIVQGDTDRANGFGSAGSRSLFTGGSRGARGVANARSSMAKDLAARGARGGAGRHRVPRPGASASPAPTSASACSSWPARQPEARILVDATSTVGGPTWPNGCHVCEVEIDPDTGAVEIVAYASVNDVGRVVNPMIVRGQIEGGAVQGIGQALCEHVVYDPKAASC